MLAAYGAVVAVAIFWALAIACLSAAACVRKRSGRKLSWYCSLPFLSQLGLAAFACTSVGFAATPGPRGDGAVLTALIALTDFPLYASTWTAACGCHPILRSASKPAGSRIVLSALLTAATVKLFLLVLLGARPDIAASWDDELGVDPTAAAHGAFGAAALIAVSTSAVALAAVVALAAANAWRGYTPHFRLFLALAFAGTCLVFLAPSFEAAAQAGLGLRCTLADLITADGSNSSTDGVACSVVVLGCTVLLPRLLAATIAAAAVEYQATTALRAQDSIRDTLRLSLPGQQLAGAGVGSEQRGQGRRSTWVPQGLAPARSTTVSVSNPITELELPVGAASAGGLGGGLALTPSLSTGESQRLHHHNHRHHHHHDAAGWGDGAGGYGGDSSRSMDSHDGGGGGGGFTPVLGMVVVEPESAAGSVPVTPVPSLPGTAGERSRFDSAGGVFDWGRRR